ncbi:MAG TPA: ferredoxin [Xanthobacteraceae bacterium]|nr:ferredoxin [Xanthobacteraceae bacterium]
MQAGLQANIAFHLTGKIPAGELESVDGLDLRPALFAEYGDLTTLRYDFPLVLAERAADAPVQSLSGLFDRALHEIAGGADGERLRKHALRFEQQIRSVAAEGGSASLSDVWASAARRISAHNDVEFQDSLKRLRAAVKVEGAVVDCDAALPFRLFRHAWNAVHERKARRFQATVGRLTAKLADILAADSVHSPEGLSAGRLQASVGATHRDAFDFDALSRLLTAATPKVALGESRRRRIGHLLGVLKSQRFYAPANGEAGRRPAELYSFVFDNCGEAVAAYRERLSEMIAVAKAIAMAGLEIEGAYAEARHDAFFADFGGNGLSASEAELFPDYLICLRAADMQASDAELALTASSSGMPAKIVVQTDDILDVSPVGEHLGFGLRGRQLTSAAMGLATVYVLQTPSSHLYGVRERILRGLAYPGPALFAVFAGAADDRLPPYLAAAAAMESRAFPAFAYDPSAGADWASRFTVLDNPQPDAVWPTHGLAFEDADRQRTTETVAFTLIDFIASDKRYARHFARVPRAKWNGGTTSVPEFLAADTGEVPDKVPCLLMVDRGNVLQRVIVDARLMREARRCAEMWRNLQELGGIHNSHAERLLARERAAWAAEQAKAASNAAAQPAPAVATSAAAPAAAPLPAAVEAEPEKASDDPYIETARCTSCNECTQINDKMFGYNENKQASIINPDAGTYRQLVEAAESCQVSIIHPGKPRNPNEPGLDELLKRAEPFL